MNTPSAAARMTSASVPKCVAWMVTGACARQRRAPRGEQAEPDGRGPPVAAADPIFTICCCPGGMIIDGRLANGDVIPPLGTACSLTCTA